ncbi:NAD(+) salvage pathway protein [Arachnomyces sp. PD_36]|nr:NAD(+) salvage pathway protein [Arachnomyces sp. PD_36]
MHGWQGSSAVPAKLRSKLYSHPTLFEGWDLKSQNTPWPVPVYYQSLLILAYGVGCPPMDGTTKPAGPFRPALIVVDMQEDFCPPNGSLAVEGARSLAPLINSLLSLPGFVFRAATLDFHPPDHVSFATNHPEPNNKPFESVVQVTNPSQPSETTIPQRLWPPHCIRDTPGSHIIPELDTSKIDLFVRKGLKKDVDMYSAFFDAFGNQDPVGSGSVSVDLTGALRERGVTDVFVVGVAGEYCVKFTAVDAVKVGFRTWVVEEGTRCVVPGRVWDEAREEMRGKGVGVVGVDGVEMGWVRGRQEEGYY